MLYHYSENYYLGSSIIDRIIIYVYYLLLFHPFILSKEHLFIYGRFSILVIALFKLLRNGMVNNERGTSFCLFFQLLHFTPIKIMLK